MKRGHRWKKRTADTIGDCRFDRLYLIDDRCRTHGCHRAAPDGPRCVAADLAWHVAAAAVRADRKRRDTT